jgi:hypothetical protein
MNKKITLNFKSGNLVIAHKFIVLGRSFFEGCDYAAVKEYELANLHAIIEEGATKEDKTKRKWTFLLIKIFEDGTFTYVTDDKIIYTLLGKLLEMAKMYS